MEGYSVASTRVKRAVGRLRSSFEDDFIAAHPRTNGHILEMMLSKWGIVPSYVADGTSALAHLEATAGTTEAVALLLMDGEMPTMDGFMLAERVRRRPGIAETPVIMLTSAGRATDAARCQEQRVQRYLLKPVRPAQLREAILEVFGGAVDQVSINGAGADVAAPMAQQPLRILVADDNVINQTILKRILEKLGHAVTLAANGQETFDIAARGSVDLVLMDVQMPVMDGLESTAAIRRHRHHISRSSR